MLDDEITETAFTCSRRKLYVPHTSFAANKQNAASSALIGLHINNFDLDSADAPNIIPTLQVYLKFDS